MKKLPSDICRCNDNSCSLRETCLRYLLRFTGAANTPHAASLANLQGCQSYIKDSEDPSNS